MIGSWRQLLRGLARNTSAYVPQRTYAEGVAEGRRQCMAELLAVDPPAREALIAKVVDAAEAWCVEHGSAGFHGCLEGADGLLYDAVGVLHVYDDEAAVSLTEEAQNG